MPVVSDGKIRRDGLLKKADFRCGSGGGGNCDSGVGNAASSGQRSAAAGIEAVMSGSRSCSAGLVCIFMPE